MAKEVPVYLFTGFLESGKTRFAQETLANPEFNNGDRILLLVCEDGVEEYDPSTFAAPNVFMETIDSEDQLSEELLAALLKKHKCDYVMVEYNGMWLLDNLYTNLPAGWMVAQEFLFIDSTTFMNYNTNMRQLMVDKMRSCELAVFNRFPAGDEELKLAAHKAVRAQNRRCDIAYETLDGKVTYDDIELPLPYDLNAEIVEIADVDYAIFLQDIMEQPEKYEGKTIRLKGWCATKARSLRPGYFFFGREVMTCCADDIQFVPLAAEWRDTSELKNKGWYTITARVDIRKMPELYQDEIGPVLHLHGFEPAHPPEEPVAMFY